MKTKDLVKKFGEKVSPKLMISLKYYKLFGHFMSWNNPKDLNEKINWLKFHSDLDEWAQLADKYRVREYLEEKGLSQLLVKLYGKYDSADEIDWDSLPEQFVLKVNNGSGDVLICTDKSKLNIDEVVRKYDNLLKQGYDFTNFEPHYARIRPGIIVEELLDVDKQGLNVSTLVDYKIWCLNGEPFGTWSVFNRVNGHAEVAWYDKEWNFRPDWSSYNDHYRKPSIQIPRPRNLEYMYEVARTLSQGFPQMRVDLYEVDGRVYFGELTLTAQGGFMQDTTPEVLLRMGELVRL